MAGAAQWRQQQQASHASMCMGRGRVQKRDPGTLYASLGRDAAQEVPHGNQLALQLQAAKQVQDELCSPAAQQFSICSSRSSGSRGPCPQRTAP